MNCTKVDMRSRGVWEHFTMSEGLPDMKIESIYEDSNNTLWIGTHDKGVVAFKEGVFQSFTVRDGLAGNGVYSIVEDEVGRLWFGTDRGLCFYFEEILTICVEMEGVSFLWGGVRDQRGELWFGVKGGVGAGVSVCNVIGQTATLISLNEKGDDSGGINDICEGNDGVLWCGGLGLYRIEEGYRVEFVLETMQMDIYSLMSDAAGFLWVSSNIGLYRYDTNNNHLKLI
ncbi:MAG: ligand-binding sensor domain-containing protein, partial [Candidatus Latescibacterota bacterium]